MAFAVGFFSSLVDERKPTTQTTGTFHWFVVLFMNRANRVIGGLKAFKGGISATVVDHRIIFATALKVLASGIVIAHNHPSGNLDASDEDLKITKKIKDAGELLDIRLIDHLILGINHDYSSFTEKGWL